MLPSQMEENLRRRAARKEHYGSNLLGDDIFELRRKFGLSLYAAAGIFGMSPDEFARYEAERAFPDEGTRMLLESAMAAPVSLPALATKVDVAVSQ